MDILIVVDDPKNFDFDLPGIKIVSANSYLMSDEYSQKGSFRIFNLCKSYRYQSYGYYVSLLAEARKHKPIPSISTIQDMKSNSLTKIALEEIDKEIQENLKNIKSEKFVLSIYFGKNISKKYESLSRKIFHLFNSPFIRATFSYNVERWNVQSVIPIAYEEIPEEHREFMKESATEYFSKKRLFKPKKKNYYRYYMGILYDEKSPTKPSDKKTIEKIIKIGESMGIESEIITKEDYGRIPEFDIIFIRENTSVNNYTYRFSRRAFSEGIAVIDDPESILKCCNKVYLAEILKHNKINIPKTLIIRKNNVDVEKIINEFGFPVVLKKPDSSFSLGVKKANDKQELLKLFSEFFEKSDLLLCQEYIPTEFDWRIGVLDKKPLFACKYYMAKKHWQIIKKEENGKMEEGIGETFPIEKVPKNILKEAVRAANLIGDGLYGVDVKEIDGKPYVIEINDNANIEVNVEDKIIRDELYVKILNYFISKIERWKG